MRGYVLTVRHGDAALAGWGYNDYQNKGMTMDHPTSRVRGPAAMLACLLALAVAAPLAGAAEPGAMRHPATGIAGSFGADLRACQAAIGGRLAQRRRLESRHPRIAACLRQRGWGPDGTPSLDRLLAPG